MQVRDRIKELRRVKASELVPNKRNWRKHSETQLQAIRGVLKEIGFAGAELARELEDGSLELIDGHARAIVSEDAIIPVLVLDVTEEEADKLLLTYDPLSAMAIADEAALEQLLESVSFDNSELVHLQQTMLDELSGNNEDLKEDENSEQNQAMELRPHEHYDFIVVLASDSMEWNVLCEKLRIKREALFGKKKTKYGICRAIKASRLLELLPDDNPVQKTTEAN